MIYTYIHKRLDGKVFYVGAGSKTRPYDKGMRSAKWKCASNNGYTIEVCAGWDTKEGAKSHEKFLISCFLDLGHPLVNASKGGDGAVGYHHTDEAVCRIKVAQSGASGFWFGKVGPTKGKVLSDEHRSKLAESKVGDRNPRFGNPITDVHRGRLTFEANRIYICVDCGYKNKAVCMAKHLRATNHTGGTEL